MYRLLKKAIKNTSSKDAWKWQVDTIRVSLLKVGATKKKPKDEYIIISLVLLFFRNYSGS